VRQPFVDYIDTQGFNIPGTNRTITVFIFPTTLVNSYEKYPESLVSGLTKIGGIFALVRIV
jgi:hypothetical protein